MFSFSKRQVICLSEFTQHIDEEMLAWSYESFHQVFGDDEFIWFAISAINHHREMRGFLDNYLRVGGDAWLKLADESHKLCLRNLNRILRTSQPTLDKEA